MSSSTLETFPNPRPERDFEITISCPEFTSVCPMTGLPDFGEIRIVYVPEAACMTVQGNFSARGGITTSVTAKYEFQK